MKARITFVLETESPDSYSGSATLGHDIYYLTKAIQGEIDNHELGGRSKLRRYKIVKATSDQEVS